MTDTNLEQRIIGHEGIRKSVYKDSLGYYTIGIGFCCDPRLNLGLSVDECMMILRSRIENLKRQLANFSWYKNQNEVRQGVLIELSYNLGLTKLRTFKNFLAAMEKADYSKAVQELKNSLWAKQVGQGRVNDICNRVQTGSY